MKKNLLYYAVYLLAISITFYAAKITPFSPIYILDLMAFSVIVIVLAYKTNVYFDFDILAAIILLIYIILTQYSYIQYGEFINIFIGLLAYIFFRMLKNRLSFEDLINIFTYMLIISIIVLTLDSIYRLTHPGAASHEALMVMSSNENLVMYLYKFNSLLFADSNTTALVSLILYFSVITLERKKVQLKYSKFMKIALSLLIVFSLSRAAIIAWIIGIIYVKVQSQKILYKMILFTPILLLSLFIPYYLDTLFSNDISFNSKFMILDLVYNKLSNSSLNTLFFGVGFGQAISSLGIYTHLLLVTITFEMGFIGLFIYILFITIYILKFGVTIWLPVLITSLSFFTYVGAPFLFIPLALTANINEKIIRKNKMKVSQ